LPKLNKINLKTFPRYTNKHLLRYSSDHNPIMLEFYSASEGYSKPNHKKLIRFEQLWAQDPESHNIVKTAWNNLDSTNTKKLQGTLHQLYDWSKIKFGDIPTKIKLTQASLEKLKNQVPRHACIKQIKEMEDTLDGYLKQEELWWAQRAKVHWLQHGDQNTKFFHYKASQRKRKNYITTLQDPSGNAWQDSAEFPSIFCDYFQTIFDSSNPHQNNAMFEVVQNRINTQDYNFLNTPFSAQEVQEAISNLKANSAPGPDGLTALFYQKYWEIIGPDVLNYTLNILNNEGSINDINHTYISLIPKVPSPSKPEEFRPISLCNVILKIITKTMANRIKKILPHIVHDNQSAFLPGRLITDNSLIVFETLNYINKPRKKNFGHVGIKLDIAKAYDSLEWHFILNTLTAMGFPHTLIKTIMLCISTVSFSILINGQPTDPFHPKRGIRQGDPLSPYIFILCAEVLSGLINKEQRHGHITGVAIATNAPSISHLLYADDSILFCRAKLKEATTIMNVLQEYQQASGQKVNMDKSEMIFSPNISMEFKKEFQSKLPIKISTSIKKYLGMPTYFGRSKEQDFNFIMDRIWKKLKGWKEKSLSFEGRAVLIRAVAQAIPTYIMSCFLLPKGICRRIEKAVCSFWWGSTEHNKKIHWTKKENLFKSKLEGGMGFKSLRDFNLAMLAKQVWRFQVNPNALVSKCFRAKYYPNSGILQANIGSNPSYAWRSIYNAIWIIQKGSCWRIGNGQSVRIWEDNWIPSHHNFKIISPPRVNPDLTLVKDIMRHEEKEWNTNVLTNNFLNIDISAIEQIPLINTSQEDEIMWMFEPKGCYSVKSGYTALQNWKTSSTSSPMGSTRDTKLWKKLWNVHTIPRHKTILWRILTNSLPIRSELEKRGVKCSPLCPRCNLKIETLEHAFMTCQYISRTWYGSQLNLKITEQPFADIKDWIAHVILDLKEDVVIHIASMLYNIWQARNQAIYEEKFIPEEIIIERASRCINDFIHANCQESDLQTLHSLSPMTKSHKPYLHWSPPEPGCLKANSDSNLQMPGWWGLGAAVRDEKGLIMASATWKMKGSDDVKFAESFALLRTIELARDCGFRRVSFEVDNELLARMIQNEQAEDRSYLGQLIYEIRSLQSCFDMWSLKHIDRSRNGLAHKMAQIAHSDPNKVWIEEVPFEANRMYLQDIIH